MLATLGRLRTPSCCYATAHCHLDTLRDRAVKGAVLRDNDGGEAIAESSHELLDAATT